MSPENAIEVRELTKKFKVYFDKGHTLKEKTLFRRRRAYEERKVLNGISFDVKRGEAVGLIGHNGCGKSTTLKLLTKIMYPDSGTIEMNGRVSSLIELGAGFHPDMSGWENIFINASIFGLTRKEIEKRIDDIVEFAGLKEYIDNPVRTYSSGMYTRLAFSVAIHVDADILLIDEILAVGDVAFQAKCFDKLLEIKKNGVTIVIVSHTLEQLEKICDRNIWMDEGKIRCEGEPKEIDLKYLNYMLQCNTPSREQNEMVNLKQEEAENNFLSVMRGDMVERFDDLKTYQTAVHKEMADRFDDMKMYQIAMHKEIAGRLEELKMRNEKRTSGMEHSFEAMLSLYNVLTHQLTELKDATVMQDGYDRNHHFNKGLLKRMIKHKWHFINKFYQEPESMKCEICSVEFFVNETEVLGSEDLYGGGNLLRYRCPSCGAVIGPNKMLSLSEDELREDYMQHYLAYPEADCTDMECQTFYNLMPEKGKIYLNYGCGAWSGTIQRLRKEGYEVYGYDPYAPIDSEFIFRDYEQLKDWQFDGIFSHDLLEHLRQPLEEFKKFYALLKERGKMAHTTACYRYVYEYTRFHLFFLTGDSVNKICEQSGFEIIDKFEAPDELYYCYVYQKTSGREV